MKPIPLQTNQKIVERKKEIGRKRKERKKACTWASHRQPSSKETKGSLKAILSGRDTLCSQKRTADWNPRAKWMLACYHVTKLRERCNSHPR